MKPKERDERIPRYIEAAEALRDGHFGVEIPVSGGADDVSRLGVALHDLSRSLERRWREVAELDAISRKINAGLLLDDVLDEFYREGREIFPYDRVGMSLLEDGGRIVRARWARSTLGPLRLGKGYAAPLEGSSLATILETGQPRVLNDLAAYLDAKPSSESTRLVVEEGVRSSLTCPLIANGVPIGFLFFSSARPGAYADAHVEAFQRLAGQLSVVVEKARLVSELTEQKADLEVRNEFIRQIFGRYLSDSVVRQLLETPGGLRLGGERRVVTVVMSDLRGFTPAAERLAPERVVSLLNLYLGEMSDVVLRHGGTIDEFLGDAMLVLFGAPIAREDDPRRALECAVEMQVAMESVNARAREMGLPEMGMGIGIHTGEVVAGNIGSERRAKYGVVGAVINLASRIQAYSLGGQILASEESVRAAGEGISIGSRFQVHPKGVREPVSIQEVIGVGAIRLVLRSDPLTPLASPVEVEVERLDDDAAESLVSGGLLHALGRREAAVETAVRLGPRDEVRLGLPGGLQVIARVLGPAGRGEGVRVRFETLSDEASRVLLGLAGRPARRPVA
jgi:class 3 adenylate cyclase